MKLAWATDIHLDHLDLKGGFADTLSFIQCMSEQSPEAILLTGDLSMANFLIAHLELIDQNVKCPVYFVLGNHDFYYGEIESTRAKVKECVNKSKWLRYLTASEPFEFSPNTVIMGHDGWYDFGFGLSNPIRFIMSDWLYIQDFTGTIDKFGRNYYINDNTKIKQISKDLAQSGAAQIEQQILATSHKNKIILTHFPPWEEASLYNGKRSEEQALPVFASKCMGEAIERSSNQNLECNHIVLAGHTHDPYCGKITNNIECRVGKARYEKPTYTIIEIE